MMRLLFFFLTRKATRPSRPPCFALGSSGMDTVTGFGSILHPNPPKIQPPPSSLSRHHYYATHSLSRDETSTEKVDVDIISRESIKPSSPTPQHLRNFNLSIFDQIFYNIYTPLVLFLPNTNGASLPDVITKRSKRLKDSLSGLLTRYYPFAGEVKDNFHIECNDTGVYFVDARVHQTLKDFLRQPDDDKVKELIPKHPSTTKSSLGNYVTSVQVNIFDCGGIALSTTFTHKLVDGHSSFAFLKAWAAASRSSLEKIAPSFVASELFPNNPFLKFSLPSASLTTESLPTTKRFVFNSTTLAFLKAQGPEMARGPTRVEATGALIWKAATKATGGLRPFGPHSPYVLVSFVNMRKRAFPPLPSESIGNLMLPAVAVCFPANKPELGTLMGQMRESIAKINKDFVEALKGENGHHTLNGLLKTMNELFDVSGEGNDLALTSLLNSGVYDIDFGWGKPVWFYHVNPGCQRLVSLNDTINGGGVEAIVSLSRKEMEIFERDPEVLEYASVDPSPL